MRIVEDDCARTIAGNPNTPKAAELAPAWIKLRRVLSTVAVSEGVTVVLLSVVIESS
jgi:hypothetical protein